MLADTTLLIDFLNGKAAAVKEIQNKKDEVCTTEINVYELMVGIKLRKKARTEQESALIGFLNQIHVLPLDRKSAMIASEICANLIKQGRQIDETDCMIAGIGIANGVKEIMTSNTPHFERIPGITVLKH